MRKLQEIKNRTADRRAAEIAEEILGAAPTPTRVTLAQPTAKLSAAMPSRTTRAVSRYPKLTLTIPHELRTPGVKYAEAIPQDVKVAPKSWMAKAVEAILPSGVKVAVPPTEPGVFEPPPLPDGGGGSFASEAEEDAEEDFEDGGGEGEEGGEEGRGEADPFWNALAEYLIEENLTQPRSPFGAFETAAIFDPRGGVADPYTQPVREEIFGDVLGAVLKKKLGAAKVVKPKGRPKAAPVWGGPTWVVSGPIWVRINFDDGSGRSRYRVLDQPLPKRVEIRGYGGFSVISEDPFKGGARTRIVRFSSVKGGRFSVFVDGQPFAALVLEVDVQGGNVHRVR